jgi:NADH dehydrogenase FAD-containing subunit
VRTLLLLGAGHAHAFVLEAIARSRQGSDPKDPWPSDWRVMVLTPSMRTVYSGMVPGYIEGRYRAEDCFLDVKGLLEAARAQWVEGHACDIDAAQQVVHYTTAGGGSGHIAYDLLSVNTGGAMNRDRIEHAMPGARDRALFARPMDQLVSLWPRLRTLAHAAAEKADVYRVAVVGAGAAGIELALTLRAALPMASISLLAGEMGAAAGYDRAFRQRVHKVLVSSSVQVLDDRCVGMNDGYLLLSSGATLSCDAPIIATGSQSPEWLAQAASAVDAPASLALDGQGFIVVNAFQQSLNRPNVFAAGDVSSRADRPHPRSGVYAVHSGPPLAANLLRCIRGQALKTYKPPVATLNLINCGNGTALAHHGAMGLNWTAHGKWVMRWKDRIDRRFVERFSMG